MLNLIKYPLCREEDLGRPIPDMIHATSVCMPLWQHNVAYEELDESITKTFKSGYPRFFYHPIVRKLFNEAEKELASDQECCLVFPNSQSAQRCLDYIEKITSQKGSKQVWRDVCAIVVPKACAV
ncbi:MAG: PLP-dependent transferase, partial [Lentisphaeria bacterium]|nr:PLP-dependent transferase [Lentisphaeria bacterium]